MTGKTIQQVLQEHNRRLISLPGVVGIAQGDLKGKPCIKVYVARKTKEIMRQIPSNIDGYEVGVEETGGFKALPTQ